MVGFSLFHGAHNFFLLGLPFVPLSLLFFFGVLVVGAIKKMRFSWAEWLLLLALLLSFSLLFIPYRYWEHFDVVFLCGPGSHGNEFLMDAAADGDLGLVKTLLAQGYDINHESAGGVTPLSAAVTGGKQELVRFVLSKGANVNAASNHVGETPLIDAAYTGNLEIVKLLLAHGAEPCVTDREGINALRMAQKYRRQAVIDYLSAHYNCPPPPPLPPSACANESAATCVEVH